MACEGSSDVVMEVFAAITRDDIAVVKQLILEKSVSVDCIDENGMTPLQQAAYKGNAPICSFLIEQGADVNAVSLKHKYSPLMFAALSGSIATTRVMLEAGAQISLENSLGRTASQLAAFVGQHECVSLINNFFSREDVEYFTVVRGFEKEPKLPPRLTDPLYDVMLNNNLNPVKMCHLIVDRPELLKEAQRVCKVCEAMCERVMKARETNELLGLKMHIVAHAFKYCHENSDNLEEAIKNFVRNKGGFRHGEETFFRGVIRDYPYVENVLIKNVVATLAKVKFGSKPSALDVLDRAINGERLPRDEDLPCTTCSAFNASKKCALCLEANYCDKRCQKLHWSTHKKVCKKKEETVTA